jgi:type I restriction enzyme S subunit
MVAKTIEKDNMQTETNDTPEGWEVLPLKEITSNFIVPMRDKPKTFKGNIPWCRIEDFNGRYLSDSKSGRCVDKEIIEMMNLKVYPKNTLLVSCSADLGRCAIVKSPLVTNQTFIGLVLNEDKVSEEFLYYYMTYHADELNNLSSGTTISYLSREQFESFEVVIPKFKKEQLAIAQLLSDIDDLIESLDELLEKKKCIKQGAMQELFTGKKRLTGFNKEWKIVNLSNIGTFKKGKGIKKNDVVDEGLPCIRYGEIYTHHSNIIKQYFSFISVQIAKSSQRIEKGDLLFTGSGETAEEIGKCVAFLGDDEVYAGGDVLIFTPRNADSIFLGYLMNYSSIVKQKANMAQGDVIVHIYQKNLGELVLSLPSKEEQSAIVQVLSEMDSEIEALEQKRNKYRQLKIGLMQQLLTGRIRLEWKS